MDKVCIEIILYFINIFNARIYHNNPFTFFYIYTKLLLKFNIAKQYNSNNTMFMHIELLELRIKRNSMFQRNISSQLNTNQNVKNRRIE